MVLIDLAAALICFTDISGQHNCYPILYGNTTPVGEYQLNLREVLTNGYGGDVIQFHENEKMVFAIHRLWRLNPGQRREQRIHSSVLSDRVITNGCINIEEPVYLTLKDCCSNDKVLITK